MFQSKRHRHAAVSAALLIAASCSDGPGITSVSPELRNVGPASASQHVEYVAHGSILKRSARLDEDLSASATITPEGGLIAIPQAGLLLYFPSGAVSQTIEVTATAVKGNRVVYDFQPHGLTFDTPIYVAQRLQLTELDTPRSGRKRPAVWAGYLSRGVEDILSNGGGNFSEVFDAFYHGKGSEAAVVFSTTHFSGYAMASGRKEPPRVPDSF